MPETLKKLRNLAKENKKPIKKPNAKTKKLIKALSPEQLSIVCKKSANTYSPFEANVDALFKKKGINPAAITYNLEKEIIRDLKTAVNPKGVRPNDDFYSYVNDRWIAEFQLKEEQKYIIQVDDFRLTQDKVFRELIGIIDNYLADPANKGTKKWECIKNAYSSFVSFNTRDQLRSTANQELQYIDSLLAKEDGLWELLGHMNSNEVVSWGCPLSWTLNPDDKNPTVYRCYLDGPQVSIVDINVYFNDPSDDAKTKKYKFNFRKQFFAYLDRLFTLVFGEAHGFDVASIFQTEVEIINAMGCTAIKQKDLDPDNYNVVTGEEAMRDFGIDWRALCIHMGFDTPPRDFISANINYLICGTKLLKEKWNTPEWRTYWVYLYIRQQARWSNEGWNNHFLFHGDFVRGQDQDVQPNLRPVYTMGFLFNTFLTNEYIRQYNNLQGINYVKSMAEDLKTVFMRIIKRNTWLQPKTKAKALEKLKHFKLTVGSPELLRPDPLLNYSPTDAWGNIVKMALWRHKEATKLVGQKVIDIPAIDWSNIPPKFVGTQAYVVNAMYTPSENGIYIPLGYIQKPFVDLDERGLEYNLSRIGFTISHEMSHSLDDWGSKYDENGVLSDWWTEADKRAFKKIQKDVIKQYEVFASYDGIKFDAEPSIGEDLADISGLAICQEYLRDFQLKNEDILPVVSLSFEAFFVYVAVQSRQQISKRAIQAQLVTNPHPLDKYRCNVPLSRTNVFRAIYQVKKGDKMWWPSVNNVWGN